VEQVVNEECGRLQGLSQIVNGSSKHLHLRSSLISFNGFDRTNAPSSNRKYDQKGYQANPQNRLGTRRPVVDNQCVAKASRNTDDDRRCNGCNLQGP
jgi:hypothetical protein